MLPPDLSLDALMREDLNVWSNRWFWVLVVSTIVVGIGIICEAPEVSAVIEYLSDGKCPDCEETAEQIVPILHDFAHWNILGPAPKPNPDETKFLAEVTVSADVAGIVPPDIMRADAAADARVAELNKTHIKANRMAADRGIPWSYSYSGWKETKSSYGTTDSGMEKKMDEEMRRVNAPPAKP